MGGRAPIAPAPLGDLSRIAIHTITTRSWSLARCAEEYKAAGFGGISVWRDALAPMGAAAAGRLLRDSGLRVASLVRGGFFAADDAPRRQAAIDANRACIDEAREIGAGMIVLVVGAVPGMPLAEARRHVADGIAALVPQAESAGVRLAIEPLHPMYAADRSCINRIREARAVCQSLGSRMVGIAVDAYHVWWDPDLEAEIALAGSEGTLFGFHVCDWRVDTRHLLNDRGLMGEGCIDLRALRAGVEAAGFTGAIEVEIFSEHYWGIDPRDYLAQIARACLERV